ncbi:MAG TPA: glycoside hydrolase family 3 C-terminal domain-containing protein, partial [Acidimicrobiales bacterium]|nr:glycoside hydrolase family 3 C-terminal domain-containing protein [Acidimicrobiales bacterium]
MSAPRCPSATEPAREALVAARLTPDEQASLTAGRDVWHLPAIDRLGIGALKMSDGPSGIRGERIGRRRSLAFACGTAAGATWDVDLLGRYGTALAAEARSKGVHLVLGPTVGIPRTPLGGRTFESFAEDPHLSARLAVAYIRGVQDQGVGCCVKHFACNDQEHERMTISAEVDARALREIHLVPFEAAVREAGTWAVMAAYNKLNGTHCSEHPELLDRILRDEWGFDGVVVSDWFGTHSTVAATTAGLDVEMPGPARYLGAELAAAAARGEIDPALVDTHARRILRLVDRCGLFDGPGTTEEEEDDDPGRRMVARELVVGSTVLLQNRGLLPLAPENLRQVAVIGPNARWIRTGGGGSSAVTPLAESSLLDELRGQLPGVDVVYEEGCRIDRGVPPLDPRLLSDGFELECFSGGGFDGEPVAIEHITTGEYLTIGDPMPGVDVRNFSVRARASFTPDIPGSWRIALANTGTARLLVDGALVVDNAEPSRGATFFGYGSAIEESEMVLDAGRAYDLIVEFRAGHTPVSGFQVRAARPVQADSLARAVEAARGADAVVLVVGSNGQWETEGTDRADLRLVGEQDELIRRVALANPQTVVVINAGAPLEMPWVDDVAAILMLWFPGEEGAAALARMLTGAAEPAGRLPITFP